MLVPTGPPPAPQGGGPDARNDLAGQGAVWWSQVRARGACPACRGPGSAPAAVGRAVAAGDGQGVGRPASLPLRRDHGSDGRVLPRLPHRSRGRQLYFGGDYYVCYRTAAQVIDVARALEQQPFAIHTRAGRLFAEPEPLVP
jgi:hypothetical protein